MKQAIRILWDGSVAIAVDKPAGLSVQAPHGFDSLETRLKDQLGDRAGYLAFPHRLDRPVSGVVLVALRKRAARLLSEQFASRKVTKTYLAEVAGRLVATPDVWRDWIRKIDGQPKAEVCEETDPGAKFAETTVELVRFDETRNTSLVRMTPLTGRMHQLRIQSALRGNPIVLDSLYGPASEKELGPRDSIRLHAASLAFRDPRNGVALVVESPHEFV